MTSRTIIDKYRVAAPRYTSYPTVPYWDSATFNTAIWQQQVKRSFKQHNGTGGISLYIHLPFCESLCTYCGCTTRITRNHGVELPYIEAVLKEWQMYCSLFNTLPIIRELHLGGGTPTFFHAANLKLLIEGIAAVSVIHPDAEFSFEAHPANTTPGHLQTLAALGFKRLSLGIQDFDPHVQLIINRVQSYEQVKTVTAQARAAGYHSVNFDLIYGLPLQTLQGLEETVKKALALWPERIAFYSYAHVPWVKPGQRRFGEQDLPDAALKQELYELGRSLFIAAGYQEIGMDHFALPPDSLYHAALHGSLHRNFMGYTTQNTSLLIGLGVSSISDAWTAFAQNTKQVEEYLGLVNANQFPVFRGHTLSAEDLIIRRHILNIMCTGHSRWDDPAGQCPALFGGLERLQPLLADGLAQVQGTQLQVSTAGKRFLRNICMALDARLWNKTPDSQLFSMAD